MKFVSMIKVREDIRNHLLIGIPAKPTFGSVIWHLTAITSLLWRGRATERFYGPFIRPLSVP